MSIAITETLKSSYFVLLTLLSFACHKPESSADSILPSRTNALARGVNLSNWFDDYSDPGQFSNRFTAATLQLIKAKGFTYVRIPIGSTILFNSADPSKLNANNLASVDAAVSRCINIGLAVTIDLHPWQNDVDTNLANDPSFVSKLASYWKAMANYFKKYDTSKIFFEVLNEPHASAAGLTAQDFSWWQPVQGAVVKAIREAAPDHFIIVGGEDWNSISGLTQLQPYSEKGIIYNFHFYDPFLFTHQGASWTGWQPAMHAANVPYPSSPQNVAPLIAVSNNQDLKDALQWYGSQRYNIDSLDAWIKNAYDWGKRNGVRIIANEFGSYKPVAPAQSRLNWLHDTRATFEKYGIGWAMWEADEGFGWINYPTGDRNAPVSDADLLHALGLQ